MEEMAKKDNNKYKELFELMTNRYEEYDKALRNKTASGPGYWVPNTVLKYILRTDNLNEYDAGSCLVLTLSLGFLIKKIPESVEKILK